jgi:hypothetical protein
MKTVVIRTKKKAFNNRIHTVHGFGFTARRVKRRMASTALWNKWMDQSTEINGFSDSFTGAAVPELVVNWWEN